MAALYGAVFSPPAPGAIQATCREHVESFGECRAYRLENSTISVNMRAFHQDSRLCRVRWPLTSSSVAAAGHAVRPLGAGRRSVPGRHRPARGPHRHPPETVTCRGSRQHDGARQRVDQGQRRPGHQRTAAPGAGDDGRRHQRQPGHGQLPRHQRQRSPAHASADRRAFGVSRRPGDSGLERYPGGHGRHRAHRGVSRPQYRQLRRQRADGGGQHHHPRPGQQPWHAGQADPGPARHQRLVRQPGYRLGNRRPAPVAVGAGR